MTVRDWIRHWIGAFPAVLLVVVSLTACAGESKGGNNARIVTLTEFSDRDGQSANRASFETKAVSPDAVGDAASGADAGSGNNPVAPSMTRPSSSPPSAAATQPAPASSLGKGERLAQPGDRIVVDSVIGQVSGQPIFADEFLEPLAERLRNLSQTARPGEFAPKAAEIIIVQLREVVLNNLFVAEAEASLTPEQQQGLLAFMRYLRERMVSESAGQLAEAQRRAAEQGKTLEQTIQERRDSELIRKQIGEKVRPRVIVAWKDVEREYLRRHAEFNPPASITLRRIRLSSDKSDLIEQVKTRLANGESFATVAEFAGEANGGLWDTFIPAGGGDITDIEINPAYKPALAGLSEGQTTPPIELDGRTVWLQVDRIDQAQAKTLFDVQRELSQALTIRRLHEERDKYIQSLFEKGIYDDLRDMGERALTVARLRYER